MTSLIRPSTRASNDSFMILSEITHCLQVNSFEEILPKLNENIESFATALTARVGATLRPIVEADEDGDDEVIEDRSGQRHGDEEGRGHEERHGKDRKHRRQDGRVHQGEILREDR